MQVPENPILGVAPDSLNFGAETEELPLIISNIDNSTLAWQVEVNEPWITLNQSSGENGRLSQTSLTATVRRKGRTAGTYSAQITATSNGGRKTVPVTMEIGQSPILSVDTQTLDFGTDSTTQPVEIRNTGTGRLTWSVQEEIAWLESTPTTGTTLDETDQISFSIERRNMLAGTYTSAVTIASDGGEAQVAVEMVVPSEFLLSVSTDSMDFGMESETQTILILYLLAILKRL